MTTLHDKTALVTGASRGIGAAVYAALSAAGARVIGTATGEAGVSAIQQAAGEGDAALLYDAGKPATGEALTDTLLKEYGGADIIIANAAINADTLLIRMKEEQWASVLETNLTAVFRLTRALLPAMLKKRGGRIIFISSVVASIGNVGQTNYCAAKAGLEGYCRALAKEVAVRGITVNAIAPGFIESDMTNQLPTAVRDHFLNNIPVGRIGQPDDIAATAAFLASDAAAYITGQVIHVNGGLYM